jgi:hypothetical protein
MAAGATPVLLMVRYVVITVTATDITAYNGVNHCSCGMWGWEKQKVLAVSWKLQVIYITKTPRIILPLYLLYAYSYNASSSSQVFLESNIQK